MRPKVQTSEVGEERKKAEASMEIAATSSVTVAPQSRRLSHAFPRNLGSVSSLRFDLFRRNFSVGNPRLRVSAASMSAFAAEKLSPGSFLDKRESGILHFVKYHGLGNDFILVCRLFIFLLFGFPIEFPRLHCNREILFIWRELGR